jgi:hypothetical protein
VFKNFLKNERKLSFKICEYYQSKPELNIRGVIEDLLLGIPQEYLEGLGAVVLCDSDSFMEYYETDHAPLGRYNHPIEKDELPWIEIVIDKLIQELGGFAKIPFIRDLIIGNTLYHEIGHHINRKESLEKIQAEKIAEKWRKKLSKYYLNRKYWYLVFPLRILVLPFCKLIEKKLKNKTSVAMW